MALMRSCRWLLWEFRVAMSSCRLAGVWFEDEVVDVVMVEFLSLKNMLCSWHWSWKIRAELRSFILYRLWAWNRSFFCLRDSCLDLSVNHLQPLLVFTASDGLAFLGVEVVLLCFILSLYFFFFILFRSLFLFTFLGWFCTVLMWLLWSIVIWKEGKKDSEQKGEWNNKKT